jgi:CysZ protein
MGTITLPANPVPRLRVTHGLKSFPKALVILFRAPRILRWLIPPLLITLIVDCLAFYFAFGWLRAGISSLVEDSGYSAWLRTGLDIVGVGAVIFLLAWSFAWLFLIFASPFQDFISVEVEREVRGFAGSAPEGFAGFLRSMWQSVVQAIVFTALTLLFLLAGFVPLAGPILLFLWSAFVFGYSFVAIPSGRMAHRITERLSFARRHIGAVMGMGIAILSVSLIPFVNVLCMPIFVIAGTLLYIQASEPRA